MRYLFNKNKIGPKLKLNTFSRNIIIAMIVLYILRTSSNDACIKFGSLWYCLFNLFVI